jgi:hypothetical protein
MCQLNAKSGSDIGHVNEPLDWFRHPNSMTDLRLA